VRLPGGFAADSLYLSRFAYVALAPDIFRSRPVDLFRPRPIDPVRAGATCSDAADIACMTEAEGRFNQCVLACDGACAADERWPFPARTAVCMTCRRQRDDCGWTRQQEFEACHRSHACPAGYACSTDLKRPQVQHCCPTGMVACDGICRPAFCPLPRILSAATCQCECGIQFCLPPKTVDPTTCQCSCPAPCPPTKFQDPDTCACSCAAGFTECGDDCVTLTTDRRNCGACANVCAPHEACCFGNCVALNRDPNCGVCGADCKARGNTCCPTQGGAARGSCVDLRHDAKNCGSCGRACAQKYTFCDQGRCACEPGSPPCGSGCCPPGETCCVDEKGNAACRDLRRDDRNCGECGVLCGSGLTCCNGTCVDLMSSPTNCGSCDIACTASQRCQMGRCVCVAGTIACGSDCCTPGLTCCTNRCADLQRDPSHCGRCGTVCPAGTSCQSGRCLCPSGKPLCGVGCCLAGQLCSHEHCCPAGHAWCNGQCIDVRSDPLNCGECNRPVTNFSIAANGYVTIVDLTCANGSPVCPANYSPCPANAGLSCCPSASPVCTGVAGLLRMADGTMRNAYACCPTHAPRPLFSNGGLTCHPADGGP
jgi:hypothetical protein